MPILALFLFGAAMDLMKGGKVPTEQVQKFIELVKNDYFLLNHYLILIF